MDLYPAIDLRAGRCVRLLQGDFATETVYDDDPVAVARRFESAGARWIHVVDLDASRGGGSNRVVVELIAKSVGTPVQTGGGVRDDSLLQVGVARVVVGSMAVSDRDATQRLCEANPERVAIGLDHRDGRIMVRGWEDGAGVDLHDAIGWPEFQSAAAFIITNIAVDGMLTGPDLAGYERLVAETSQPVVASGGVGTLDHLRALTQTGVAGVIVGKALYEGRFRVEEAIAACEP
ncbi:MAG: HisA/HisF-related TIM barrel protein [Acidimicrobiales bacterium]